ncbi:MAG: hypothetical protein PWR24_1681 [Desulfonauticus sp.]|nr:hypothetical protein [Desulfonauticus sp.]
MKWLKFFNLFSSSKKTPKQDKGLFLFANTSEVIAAEKVLKEAGYKFKVVGPPPAVRKGCDLALEVLVVESLGCKNLLLKKQIEPLDFLVLDAEEELLQPVDLFKVVDFGDYFMVRAANMKISVEKKSGRIVNVSGGGCPDVPYLASLLIGKTLKEAPNPRECGHTLCGYALGLAFEEIQKRCLF